MRFVVVVPSLPCWLGGLNPAILPLVFHMPITEDQIGTRRMPAAGQTNVQME
jgi:hypothetical protein